MNDKQMLELAAKAAGLLDKDCRWLKNGKGRESLYWWDASIPDGVNKNVRFDPLTDDGDALRLAVKLKIEFYIADSEGFASYAGYPYTNGTIRYASEWHDDSSPETATRRAITRAAAEIGRAL